MVRAMKKPMVLKFWADQRIALLYPVEKAFLCVTLMETRNGKIGHILLSLATSLYLQMIRLFLNLSGMNIPVFKNREHVIVLPDIITHNQATAAQSNNKLTRRGEVRLGTVG